MYQSIWSMKHNLLVSACIITYNQEKYIRQCLEGAINQKVDFDYEIIIGEDKSTDATLAICSEYAAKYPHLVKLINRSKNLGVAGNWAETIQACSGKYIALCEGDDYWTDMNKLQKQVHFLEANPGYTICFHKVLVLKNNELVDDWITAPPKDATDIHDLIESGNYIHTPSVIFRNRNIVVPAPFLISPTVDFFLYVLLTQDGAAIKYLDEVMCVYRYGVGIYSKTDDRKKSWDSYNTLFLINSCLDVKYKKKFAVLLDKARSYIEEYATVHFATAQYLSREMKFSVLINAVKLSVLRKFNKK